MVDVVTTPDPRGPAGGSHRTIAVMVIVVALIFLALFWVMNKGGHNKISDRVDSVPAPTAPASGTAGSTPADATQPRGGNTGR